MSHSVEFSLPGHIRDFIFDLHDAMRRSQRMGEVQRLYDVGVKEVTEKYFSTSPWPDAKSISSVVRDDEIFLLIYREMIIRQQRVSPKVKTNPMDHIDSWLNYLKLFEYILNAKDGDLCITTQWIYDIAQEFAYQFQGFCQYRCQVATHSPEVLKILDAHRDAWAFPAVESILLRLIKLSSLSSSSSTRANSLSLNAGSFKAQFGYFASIELARLYCLLGDYNESLSTLLSIKLFDRSELFAQMYLCHFNVFYHNGVCKMMIGHFSEAADMFADIITLISRILKPGAAASVRQTFTSQLQKMLDKVLILMAIVSTLDPFHQVDDVVMETVENKWAEKDKLRKLQSGEVDTFAELFTFASPKFVSAVVPDYSSAVNMHQDAGQQQLAIFLTLVRQQAPFFKVRSVLSLYASIDISKLARLTDIAEDDLVCLLVSFKSRQGRYGGAGRAAHPLQYHLENDVLVMSSSSDVGSLQAADGSNKKIEKFFIAGMKKHAEINKHMISVFERVGF